MARERAPGACRPGSSHRLTDRAILAGSAGPVENLRLRLNNRGLTVSEAAAACARDTQLLAETEKGCSPTIEVPV